jgi:hypothetical protein
MNMDFNSLLRAVAQLRIPKGGNMGEYHIGEKTKYRLHPNWEEFIQLCKKLKYGEVLKIRIQGGIPVGVEETKKRIDFSKQEGSVY